MYDDDSEPSSRKISTRSASIDERRYLSKPSSTEGRKTIPGADSRLPPGRSKSKSIDQTTLQALEETEEEVSTEGQCRLNHTLVLRHEALCCQTSPDGRLLAVGLLTGAIRIYDPPVLNCLSVLATKDVIKALIPVTSVKFQPSLKIGALKTHIVSSTYSNGFVKLWNVEAKQCLHTFIEDRQSLTSAFSRDGLFLSTAGSDGKILIYDVETFDLLITLEAGQSTTATTGHRSRVFSLVYHSLDFHSLISGGWDNVVHIWDDRQKHSVRTILGPHICGDGIDLIAEENLLMTASWHKRYPIQLWHFETCELIKTVTPDATTCFCYCGQFMKKNYMIVGGSNVNMVRVIDRLSYSTIAAVKNLPKAVISATHNPFFVHPKVICVSGEKIFVVDVKLRGARTGDEDTLSST